MGRILVDGDSMGFLIPGEMHQAIETRPDEGGAIDSYGIAAATESSAPLSDSAKLADRPYFIKAFDCVKKHISGETVAVDLGCGHELNDLRILQSCGCLQLIGIDILPKPRTLVRGGELAYVRGNVDELGLPLKDASCDIVILNNVLEHLYDPMNVLTEAARVLRSGGFLIIITPNHADLKNRMLLLAGKSINFPLRRWLLTGEDRIRTRSRSIFTGHIREYTGRELRDMISLIGMQIAEFAYIATARAQLQHDDESLSSSLDGMEDAMRRNWLLFRIYSLLERIIPSLRAQISVVAKKI